jgi:hypothetical protein
MAKNPYINIYGGEVTEGGTDGELISCDGSFFYPISMFFDISKPAPSEKKPTRICMVQKFAVRTEPGWAHDGVHILITQPTETYSRSRWAVNMYHADVDDNGWTDHAVWGNRYVAETVNKNKIFYLRLAYNGLWYEEDLDKLVDHFGHYQDTGINIRAKIAPFGFVKD